MIDLKKTTQTNYLNFDLATEIYRDGIARGVAPKTARQYRVTAENYSKIINLSLLNYQSTYIDFKPSLVEYLEFCRESGFSYQTIKVHFSALNNIFMYLIDNGIISINPVPQFRTRYVRTYKAPPHAQKQDLSIEDIETLLKTVPRAKFKDKIQIEKYTSIILIFALTGIRINELIPLNFHNFDPKNGFLILDEHDKRTNNIIPISRQIIESIEDYLFLREQRGETLTATTPLFLNELNNGRIGEKTLQTKLKEIATLCGLHNPQQDAKSFEKITAHTFRHFFTKTMRENGMPISYVAEMRGDKRSFFAIQDWYYNISYRELKKVYNLYVPILKIPTATTKQQTLISWQPAATNKINIFENTEKKTVKTATR